MPNYPDLSKAKLIAIDTETYDPDLHDKGTGAYINSGRIVGFSIGDDQGFSEYYDVAHFGCSDELSNRNYEYLAEVMALPIPKVGANLMYDLGWIEIWKKIKVVGPYYDILTAEPILDEYCRGKNSLDALAAKYLDEKKENDELLAYCAKMGWKTTKRQGGREYIWKMPFSVVESYGKGDAEQPIKIWKIQEMLLKDQGLWKIYDLEQRLYPLLLKMKQVGVRVAEDDMFRLGMHISDEIFHKTKKIAKFVGKKINVNSAKDLKEVFDKNGWVYERNEPTEIMKKAGKEGNPCFNKNALKRMDNPFAKQVLEVRHLSTLMSLYLVPFPKMMHEGRLRANFNPLASDEGGTISGRFSSSKPNLQQVSSKDEASESDELLQGQAVRKLFIPEEGCSWLKIDWSQIEYRLMAHYGIGAGSELIRSRYNSDPKTDYHDEMMKMTGLPDRKVVKTLNFGAAYEMGPRTMANDYGWELEYAKNVYKLYHEKVPFIKHTSKRVARKAEKVGHIVTILGRKARLKYRDKSYVMFNRLIQGSAADLMKLAMVQAWEEGIFGNLFPEDISVEVPLFPHLTVHDELDCSMPENEGGRKTAKRLVEIMETCLDLKVPIIADAEIGKNWGTLESFE